MTALQNESLKGWREPMLPTFKVREFFAAGAIALAASAVLSCCAPRKTIADNPMVQNATKQDIVDLRRDLSASFQTLYGALVQQIKAGPAPKATKAKGK